MDVRIKEVAAELDGLVTWAALLEAGLTQRQVERATVHLRVLHDGVFLTGHGRITTHQRRLAATLTAPGSVLSHGSGGAHWGIRPWNSSFEVVTRPGSGGPQRIGTCSSAAPLPSPVTSPAMTASRSPPRPGPSSTSRRTSRTASGRRRSGRRSG